MVSERMIRGGGIMGELTEKQSESHTPRAGEREAGAPKDGNPFRAMLRGLNFTDGEAALIPPGNPGAPGAPGTPGAAPKAVLDPKAALAAWNDLRAQALPLAWMRALQGILGAPATGLPTLETVQALASREAAAGARRPTGRLTHKLRKELETAHPELAAAAEPVVVAETERTRVNTDGSAPENEAVRRLGAAASYADYASKMKRMPFLGQSVTGHPAFIARLQNAVAWMQSKHPGKAPEAIGRGYGLRAMSSFRTSTASSDQMYHGLGFALDVNPAENNWHFGNGSRGVALGAIMNRVGELLGGKHVASAADMSRNARAATTQDAFAAISASSDALTRYRRLATDRAELEAHMASSDCSPAAKRRGVDKWQALLSKDQKWCQTHLDKTDAPAGEEVAPSGGFTSLQDELVTALRDAAGLRWGGTDLGGDNGDLMHFDAGTDGTARRLRNEVRKVRDGSS